MDKQDLPPHIEDTPTDTEKTTEKTKKGVLSLYCPIIVYLTITTFIIWFNIQVIVFTIQIDVLCFYLVENAKPLAKTAGISTYFTILFPTLFIGITPLIFILCVTAIMINVLLAAFILFWVIIGSVPDTGESYHHSGLSYNTTCDVSRTIAAGSVF